MRMEIKNLRVIVTGGAGFIGSHLADTLLEMGNTVICYDCFTPYYTGKEANIEHNLGNPRYRLIKADIFDTSVLASAMKGVDVVFHLAAQPGVRYSIDHPDEVLRINTIGTLNLLKTAKQQDVRRVVYASSSSVYGNPKYTPVDEDHPTEPISPYGISKLASEKYCQYYYRIHGMDIRVLRYFTVYGPRQRPDMAIHIFTKAILEKRPPTIFGDGYQARDFTYVEDVVRGTILASERDGVGGEVFNIGAGHQISVNKLFQLLSKLAGLRDEIKPQHVPAKLEDVRETLADITKARKILGYNPHQDLEEGLKNFQEWLIEKTSKIS